MGHSLGGGEAAASALATERRAITFNAAGVSPLTSLCLGLGSRSDLITNYVTTGVSIGSSGFYIGGCGVTNLQDKVGLRAPGRRIEIPLGLPNPFKSHSINQIVNYLKENR